MVARKFVRRGGKLVQVPYTYRSRGRTVSSIPPTTGGAIPITPGDLFNVIPLGGASGIWRNRAIKALKYYARGGLLGIAQRKAIGLGIAGGLGIAIGRGLLSATMLIPGYGLYRAFRRGRELGEGGFTPMPETPNMTPMPPGWTPEGGETETRTDYTRVPDDSVEGTVTVVPPPVSTPGSSPIISVPSQNHPDLAQLALLLGIPLAVLMTYLGIRKRKKRKKRYKKRKRRIS